MLARAVVVDSPRPLACLSQNLGAALRGWIMGTTGEISFLETDIPEHALHELDVLRFSAVRCARYCELFIAPAERIESARREEWQNLEWLRAGSPEGEGIRVTRGAEELVSLSNYGRVYSMLRFGSKTAGDDDIELKRFDHNFKILSLVPKTA